MRLIRQSETLSLPAELYMQEYSNLSSLPSAFLGNLIAYSKERSFYNEKPMRDFSPHNRSISFDVQTSECCCCCFFFANMEMTQCFLGTGSTREFSHHRDPIGETGISPLRFVLFLPFLGQCLRFMWTSVLSLVPLLSLKTEIL